MQFHSLWLSSLLEMSCTKQRINCICSQRPITPFSKQARQIKIEIQFSAIPAGTGEAAAAATLLLFREVGGVLGGRSSVALVRFSQPEIASSLPGFDSGFRVRTELAFSMEFLRTWEKVKLGFTNYHPLLQKEVLLSPSHFSCNRNCLRLARV